MSKFPDAPDYWGSGLVNLANTLLAHFGCVPRGPRLRRGIELGDRVLLVLLDRLGWAIIS